MANESPDLGIPAAVQDQPVAPVDVTPDNVTQAVTFNDAAVAAATDAPGATDGDAAGGRCPWCSAGLALGAGLPSCPSCGAQLSGDDNTTMPGLTQVVPVAMRKAVSAEPVRRSRLLAWISGEMIDEPSESAATTEALALPSRDVRREILRIELESAGLPIPPALIAPDPATEAAEAATAAADQTSTAA
jgi:hypothetical protein